MQQLPDTLFNDALFIQYTQSDIETVKWIHENMDPYYIASWLVPKRKTMFDKLWLPFKPYSDSNFLKEIKTNFNQKTWEMYVANIFIFNEIRIKSHNTWPDIIVPWITYIECVAPTKWDPQKLYSVPNLIREKVVDDDWWYYEHASFTTTPEKEMLLRITSTISYKANIQYKKRQSKSLISDELPFVIAINTSDFEREQSSAIPLIIKALFGFGDLAYSYIDGRVCNPHRTVNEFLDKWFQKVPSKLFLSEEFSHVSAVIRSCDSVVNSPETIWMDCILVHNPNAVNKLDESIFAFLDQRKWIRKWDQFTVWPIEEINKIVL